MAKMKKQHIGYRSFYDYELKGDQLYNGDMTKQFMDLCDYIHFSFWEKYNEDDFLCRSKHWKKAFRLIKMAKRHYLGKSV
jgi:hypothetical protein